MREVPRLAIASRTGLILKIIAAWSIRACTTPGLASALKMLVHRSKFLSIVATRALRMVPGICFWKYLKIRFTGHVIHAHDACMPSMKHPGIVEVASIVLVVHSGFMKNSYL